MERRARLGDRTAKTRAGIDRQRRHLGPPADLRALLHHGERGARHRT